MKIVKNNNHIYLLVLLLLLIPSQILMLKKPLYPSHDGLLHVMRIEQFHQAIIEGQIPPRIAPTFADNIGFPIFIVNYQLPYFLAEPFMLTTNDPIFAFKSVMIITYLLSGVFSFLLFKNFGSNLASLTGSILFCYTPYRFANLFTRGALGESVSIMFVPLVLLALHLVAKKKKFSTLLLIISIFGLITSHSVIFLLFLPFFIFYIIIFLKLNRQILINILFGVIFGILLSSFQLLPAIFEKQYTQFESFLNLYGGHFIGINQLFRIPKSGITPSSPFQIGLVSSLTVLLSLIFSLFRKNVPVLFFLIMIFLSIFAIHSSSLWFWDHIFFLKYINFPWRFLSIVVISTAFLSVYLVNQTRFKMIAFFLITLALFTSRHYFLYPTQYESTLPTQVPTFPNEYDTIWSNENTFQERPFITVYPTAQVTNFEQKKINISFKLKTSVPTEIIIRKLYFPGWKIKINGLNHTLDQRDGLISFDTGSGEWSVDIYFSNTPIRKFANALSIVALLSILILFSKIPILKNKPNNLFRVKNYFRMG